MKNLLAGIVALSLSACATTRVAQNDAQPEAAVAESTPTWVWWAVGGAAIVAVVTLSGSDDEAPQSTDTGNENSGNTGQTCVSGVCVP